MKIQAGVLNKDLPIPLYYQLRTILIDQIKGGTFKAHDRLPAEDEIAASFGVSKATVRQAMNELVSSGLVRREQGRGTFVAEPKIELGPRELTSFTQEMSGYGLQPSSRVLRQQMVKAENDVAEKLRLSEGTEVLELKRLRMAQGEPMGIQTAFVALRFAPDLLNENFETVSLYEILKSKYGVIASRAKELHYAVLLSPQEAKQLKVPEGSPGLAGERVTFVPSGEPFELVYSVMRGDRYRIVMDLGEHQIGS
ncbi:MAG TPA: GntR family transcriptional regulator [Blastocatellia bacterium]|nr:GntR family transcriptional regulator [Blastocatellia bacterium]